MQITWNAGRTVDVKKALFRALADGIHAATGIRKEDVILSLVGVPRQNWSLGGGEMTFAPM